MNQAPIGAVTKTTRWEPTDLTDMFQSTYDSGFLTPLDQCTECFLSALSGTFQLTTPHFHPGVTYEKWHIHCIPQAERRTYKSSELQRNWSASWISLYFSWKDLIIDPQLYSATTLMKK
jgi:hypothetical protein